LVGSPLPDTHNRLIREWVIRLIKPLRVCKRMKK
jgi:hypothetical protein